MKKHTAAKALSVAALAGAIALAPVAASGYAGEPGDDTLEYTIGVPLTVTFPATYIPFEDADITLTGISASTQGLASAGTVDSQTITNSADAEGTVTATVTFNDSASGSYDITAVGQESGISSSVTLVAASTGGGGGGTGDGDGGLPATGMDTAALGLWVGGGALLLGGGAALVARSVRKQNAKA